MASVDDKMYYVGSAPVEGIDQEVCALCVVPLPLPAHAQRFFSTYLFDLYILPSLQHNLSHLPTVLRRLLLRRTTSVIVCPNAGCAIIGLLEVDSPSSTFCVFLSVFLTLYFLDLSSP